MATGSFTCSELYHNLDLIVNLLCQCRSRRFLLSKFALECSISQLPYSMGRKGDHVADSVLAFDVRRSQNGSSQD